MLLASSDPDPDFLFPYLVGPGAADGQVKPSSGATRPRGDHPRREPGENGVDLHLPPRSAKRGLPVHMVIMGAF